jgi:predicted acyltransferase
VPEKPSLPKRLTSLDAFRGLTIIAMLMVNNPGYDSAFPRQFRHAHWGEMITFCDLIFPWFLFIVGVAIPFSASAFHKKSPGFFPYLRKAVKRMLLLVFFGILIDSSINKQIVIGMDVLQLIGLAYFCGAVIYELPKRWRPIIAAALLILHWAAIRFIPIPGVGAGFFEPDKNLIQYINQHLGPYHLAGIVSVVPTTALVLIGTFFGDLFRDQNASVAAKLRTVFIAGAVLIAAGILWHLDLPFNKNVWSASYILFSAGTASFILGAFFFIIDDKGYRKWAFPFVVYGMNAITAYFFSIIVRVHTVQEWYTQTATGEKITLWHAILNCWTGLAGITVGSWLFTLSYICFWWLILYWMYRKRLFLRV